MIDIHDDSSPELTAVEREELFSIRDTFNTNLIEIMKETNQNQANMDLSLVWQETDNLTVLYEQLSDLKKCLDSFRPFEPNMLKNYIEATEVQYTYDSNRIEGNSLTLAETEQVIRKGLTIGGKPLNDHLEAINHQQAIHYIRELVQQNIELSEREIKNIHALILKSIMDSEAGAYRKVPVYILNTDGHRHDFPQPYLVPKLMEDFFIFFNENKDKLHPVAMASNLHQKLVNIHPFIDGNGRTSRLVMNLFLIQNGYPIAIIDSETSKRKTYYSLLADYQSEKADNSKPFELFIAQKVKESLFEQLNFFSQDMTDEGLKKGYYFFKKIEPYLKMV